MFKLTLGLQEAEAKPGQQHVIRVRRGMENALANVDNNNNPSRNKVTATGEVALAFGCEGSGDGQLNDPRGICFDTRDNRIFVADKTNHR